MSTACEPGGHVRPLVYGRRRAVVDGHPICAACGTAAVPVGPDRWRHQEPGEPYPYDSPWLAPPVTWAELRDLTTFACFTDRYPDVARDVSEEDWREGRRRWAAYQERLQSRAGENPLLDLVKILVGGRVHARFPAIPEPLARVLDLDGRRRELASRFSWAIPTEAALGLIGDHGPLLEVGAGTGYWAALSRERGIDVRPTDADPAGHTYHRDGQVWTEVQRSDAVDAVRTWPDRTLLICWPPPDDDAAGYAAVRAYAGDTVLYIGGGGGRADRDSAVAPGARPQLDSDRRAGFAVLAGNSGSADRLAALTGAAPVADPGPVPAVHPVRTDRVARTL